MIIITFIYLFFLPLTNWDIWKKKNKQWLFIILWGVFYIWEELYSLNLGNQIIPVCIDFGVQQLMQ